MYLREFEFEFRKVWQQVLVPGAHLDSLIHKVDSPAKPSLARILPEILRRPVSLADEVGVSLEGTNPFIEDERRKFNDGRVYELAKKTFVALSRGAKIEGGGNELDFPEDLIRKWSSSYGEEKSKIMAERMTAPVRQTIRINRAGFKDSEFLAWLEPRGKFTAHSPFGFTFAEYTPFFDTPYFEKGFFEVQDEGSQLLALIPLYPDKYSQLLTASPGWPISPGRRVTADSADHEAAKPLTVIDACSGAGGKALAFSDAMQGRGRVYAYDIFPRKLQALKRRAQRTDHRNIQVVALTEGQERETLSRFNGKADIVLVDAPCGGWGVLKRNPDIKWKVDARAAEAPLEELQLRLLNVYAPLVKPGGTLYYGTCTFRTRETLGVVEKFLDQNSDKFESMFGGFIGPGAMDGFFLQGFRRSME